MKISQYLHQYFLCETQYSDYQAVLVFRQDLKGETDHDYETKPVSGG